MNLAGEFLPSVVSLYLRGKANRDTGVPAAAAGDWDLPAVVCPAGHVQRWPSRGVCRAHSLLGHPHDRAVLPERPRSPERSRQLLLCAVTVQTRSPSSELPQKSPETAGELSRLTYTPLLPAQAASLLCLQQALLPVRAAIPGTVTAFFHNSTRH